jgi:pimeloyl-ACP methyl ester carboxylesterase
MLGYGKTDKPYTLDQYSTKNLTTDLVALLDLLGVDKATVIGISSFSRAHPIARYSPA